MHLPKSALFSEFQPLADESPTEMRHNVPPALHVVPVGGNLASMRAHSSLVPLSLALLVAARLHHTLPDDPYAYPKYRVTFLNGLPVLNETADRWLREGLQGGMLEFLDQPWKDAQLDIPQLKAIEGSSDQQASAASPSASPLATNHTLEHMKLGSQLSYMCLIPPPPEDTGALAEENSSTGLTPVHSWSLLQPLTGTCLYTQRTRQHKQGWFTYSYCHNMHVRQFHELPQKQPHRPGEYKPEEDTEWESYTLGQAPPSLEAGADLTVAEEAAIAANLELARGAGSHYLVQRWGDGTFCDKTGGRREIEVQFHCSMTMTDTILFVKETQTCHYVLHIATPRLCGEPGFKSRLDAREEAYIRCREILSADDYERADRTLPPADQPLRKPKRAKPIIAPPPAETSTDGDVSAPLKNHGNLIRKALERLLARDDLQAGTGPEIFVEQLADGEELVIQFIDADVEVGDDDGDTIALSGQSIADILRAAGYDIQGEKDKSRPKRTSDAKQGADEEGEEPRRQRRDEL
ncbi:uncharacterized protein FIBRA_04444 [Fibroporia radiculosa]|uniref:Protein OS-9 homolog n=1 Tax=Fibroporia radiculosa TaxID=599839 RepID=J4H2Y8_9APHY|nr:uncharacterized protein FIBRA_04444 [Fibroporia radiculosa]CCM02349.1 predicted protein [Fibroporia radiculosa]